MKDTSIRIRISEELKNEFFQKCEGKLQVPSMVLRKFIEDYVKEGQEMGKYPERYYFEKKEYDDGIYVRATSGGWTTEYYPDGDSDTSLEMTGVGEEITSVEAKNILNTYGWEICKECGKIVPEGTDCYCRA